MAPIWMITGGKDDGHFTALLARDEDARTKGIAGSLALMALGLALIWAGTTHHRRRKRASYDPVNAMPQYRVYPVSNMPQPAMAGPEISPPPPVYEPNAPPPYERTVPDSKPTQSTKQTSNPEPESGYEPPPGPPPAFVR